MPIIRNCPRCGVETPGDAPEGPCPECLTKLGGPGPDQPATAPYYLGVAPPSPAKLAKHFPHLEIVELLGRGGMGVVYKVRQMKLDRFAALKILRPDAGPDPAFAERFTREARSLAKLSHPGIVGVYDFGDSDGLFYFLMELVDGVNLRHLLRPMTMQPAEALKIVPQLCDALQYAHDEGIVHRDVKPENILLDKKGRVKIADFGLAKLMIRKAADYTLTESMQVMGTLNYMAPEQMEKPLEVDHRADIYSLGVVFYEMLTGELPLGRFAPPSQKVQVDSRLDEVVLRALEKEPQLRYQQVSEFRMAIQSLEKEPEYPIRDEGETKTGIVVSERVAHPEAATSMPTAGLFREEAKLAQGQREASFIRAGGCFGSLLGGIVGGAIGITSALLIGFSNSSSGAGLIFGLLGAAGGHMVGRIAAGFYIGYMTAERQYHPRKPDA